MAPYLIIPGWDGSGPDHWQSHWERDLPDASRVEMADWQRPRRTDWVDAIDQMIRSSEEPPILIAHSLGCVAVAYWAARSRHEVRGALLVAPADLDRETCPSILREFGPVPRAPLPFASHVVASDDDPYVTLERATQIADEWGSSLTILHGAGHINTASGHGRWSEGRALLRHFDDDVPVNRGARFPCGSSERESEDPPWVTQGLD
jgi:uncharacterized protein